MNAAEERVKAYPNPFREKNWGGMPMQEFWKSETWRWVRLNVIERDKCCRLCASMDDLRVHHICYCLGVRTPLHLLTLLCDRCHGEFHARLTMACKRCGPWLTPEIELGESGEQA